MANTDVRIVLPGQLARERAQEAIQRHIQPLLDRIAELEKQRDEVLALVDDRQPATVPIWLRDDIRDIYAKAVQP